MKKTKILHIGISNNKGGIESFIKNVCSNLNNNNYTIFVASDGDDNILNDDFRKIGCNIIVIPSINENKIDYIRELWHCIDKSYDVIHLHKNSLANPLPILICKIKGVNNIVLHSHNTSPTNEKGSSIVHYFFRFLFNRLSMQRIACSVEAAKWMFGKNFKRKNVLLLKNGIDITKYSYSIEMRKKIRSMFSLSDDAIAICNIGRLVEQKNTLYIIKIFNEVLKKKSNAYLFLVGDGPLKKTAEDLVNKLGIIDKVHFLGLRNDVNEIYQGMDLFLMPSLHEGLPIAAIEAQTSGLPLLISDTVDRGVKLCESTEFESLSSNETKWAEHCLALVNKTERHDNSNIITQSGYNINNTIAMLSKVYGKEGVKKL